MLINKKDLNLEINLHTKILIHFLILLFKSLFLTKNQTYNVILEYLYDINDEYN